MVAEFSYVLLMSQSSPLAMQEEIAQDDLAPLIEISHADPHVPAPLFAKIDKEERSDSTDRKIILSDRAIQFDLLSRNPRSYMWVSPVPQKILERYGLIQRACIGTQRRYKDVLIYRNGYKLTKIDKQFITFLCEARRTHLK